MNIEKKQKKAVSYYDKFSFVYDLLSPKYYYHKARKTAIKELHLEVDKTILNVPIGTGQNLEYFQKFLKNTGLVIGIDLSKGMLLKAQKKIEQNSWSNIWNSNTISYTKVHYSPLIG